MQQRLNLFWLVLFILAGVFCLLYLWYVLNPGRIPTETLRYFTEEQVLRGRAYTRALRVNYIVSFLVQVVFLSWLVFGQFGSALASRCQRLSAAGFWPALLVFIVGLWLALQLLELPFSYFSGYYWQHRWGFSTQNFASWILDLLKSAGIDFILFAAGSLLLFWAMRHWQESWWWVSGVFVSLWLVIQIFLWPVLISPLFNKFEPARDPAVINMVQELSAKEGVPVEQILIMDASIRTTQSNAYFTGLGKTKRIVLYDTLLTNYSFDEVKNVVAHEMAHWSKGHITQGLLWGIAGNFLVWWLLYQLLKNTAGYGRQPLTLAGLLLFTVLIFFISNPLQNYLSRQMETEADRTAVAMTGDIPAAVNLEINLAAKNYSDVAPAPFVRWFGYSHPPAPERIGNIKEAGKMRQ